MKVKCAICGLKGYYNPNSVSEFYASRFLFVVLHHRKKTVYVCRNCVKYILNSLMLEQYKINKLYEPEIKEEMK